MIKKRFCFIVVIFLCFSEISFSQTRQGLYGDYERDTIRGRNYKNFIKPKKAVYNYSFSEVDVVPTLVKKCKGLFTNEDKEQCFGHHFFELLRKRIRVPGGLIENKPITVITQFTINEIGGIEDIVIVKSTDYTGRVEKNIIRILNKMPDITPAMMENQFVKVTYTFPIKIEL